MLNIEVIKFEAQDVITASVAAPATPCAHENKDWIISEDHNGPDEWEWTCKDCGTTGTGF